MGWTWWGGAEDGGSGGGFQCLGDWATSPQYEIVAIYQTETFNILHRLHV